MADDIITDAQAVLSQRWEQPGPDYPEPVPTGLVCLGDWASENLRELVDAVKAARPHIITTEDELHSLQWQMGTVVQEVHTGHCCTEPFCDFYQPLWEMAFQCGWTRAGRMYDDNDDSPRLPVRVLWNPAVTHA